MTMNHVHRIFDTLSELDPSAAGSWPGWARAGAIAMVGALILGSGTALCVLPKANMLDRLRQEELALKQEFKAQYQQVAQLALYKTQLAVLQQRLSTRLKLLAKPAETSNLLNAIAQARQASGLQQRLFRPQPPIRNKFYVILPTSVTVVGTYRELAELVSRVATLANIVTIHDLEIQPVDATGRGQLQITMTVAIYQYVGTET